MEPAHRIALLVAGGLFLAYVVLKLRVSLEPRGRAAREGRQRIAAAKRRARDRGATDSERASAWRDAADAALTELERPDLAASYALRAERLQPSDRAAVGMWSIALRKSSRLRALEKLLWRRLDQLPSGSPSYAEAYTQLVSLYEGPLRAPERARTLRRLHAAAARLEAGATDAEPERESKSAAGRDSDPGSERR